MEDINIEPGIGRVAAAQVTMPDGPHLRVASVNTVPRNVPRGVADGNNIIFTELCARFRGSAHIIGGDLNSARCADGHLPGWTGHLDFFEGIAGRQLVNCTWELHGIECQTFIGEEWESYSGAPFQDDHIFASTEPRLRPVAAQVHEIAPVAGISDHLPIEVEISNRWLSE